MARDPDDHWRNRRLMAYMALVAALGFPFIAWLMPIETVKTVTVPLYLFCTGIVMNYITGVILDDRSKRQVAAS